jgi:predicted nuclease of restriction endonuclease-like RecB superfamily
MRKHVRNGRGDAVQIDSDELSQAIPLPQQFALHKSKNSRSPRFLTVYDLPFVEQVADFRSNHLGALEKDFTKNFKEWIETSPQQSKLIKIEKVVRRLWGAGKKKEKSFSALRQKTFLHSSGTSLGLGELYGDIKELRRVNERNSGFCPAQCLGQINRNILKGMLLRTLFIEIKVTGPIKTLIKLAKWRGLMIECAEESHENEAKIVRVSGPFSLFSQTTLYTNGLLSVFSVLAWDHTFDAWLLLVQKDGQHKTLKICHFDGMKCSKKPRGFDSKVEKSFFTDFQLLGSDWIIEREQNYISTSDSGIFPDFSLKNKFTGEVILLEIIGFWTEEYLNQKFSKLEQMNRKDFILCIDRKHSLVSQKFELQNFQKVFFDKTIDQHDVLKLINNRS